MGFGAFGGFAGTNGPAGIAGLTGAAGFTPTGFAGRAGFAGLRTTGLIVMELFIAGSVIMESLPSFEIGRRVIFPSPVVLPFTLGSKSRFAATRFNIPTKFSD